MVTDPFVAQLAGLCRRHPTRAKWVFVPTHAIGATLGERLAREGTDWVNLRFVTPLDVAVRTAAPFLLERQLTPADDDLGPALVLDLLQALPREVPAYFRRLPPHPLLGDALWRSLRELRLAGITAASLPADAFDGAADKHAELRALLAAFEAFLAQHGLADAAAVLAEATRRPDWCPLAATDLRLEYPDVLWAPLIRGFLDAMPGEPAVPAVAELAGVGVPRRLAGRPRAAAAAASPLAWLKSPDTLPPRLVPPDGTLRLFKAGGREAEVEHVLRQILSRAPAPAPLDAVEVACVSRDDEWLVWLKAQRYGLAATTAGGLPLETARPARALLAWCEWVDDGFPASGLRRMFQSGDVAIDLASGVGPGAAARLLLKSEATWGRHTYDAALGALASRSRQAAADVESDTGARAYAATRAAQAEALRDWIVAAIAAVPQPEGPQGSEPEGGLIRRDRLMEAALAFVREHGRVVDGVDRAARAACEAALAGLSRQGSGTCTLGDGLALVRAALVGRRICAEGSRPGALHITRLEQAGLAGRPLSFIIGLEEGRVFPQPFEDPVLLDRERERIHADLPRSQDRVDEAVVAVLSRVAALPWPGAGREPGAVRPSVCLSYSCRDLRENRPTLPSWLMLHAYRLTRPGETLSFEDLDAALGEPVSVLADSPQEALSDAGWWLSALKPAGPTGRNAVRSAFPSLVQGETAEGARESGAFTIYDGWVPAAGPALDPRQSGQPVSATALERLGECPFRYFLERGLGLEPIDEDEDDDDLWLDALTYGSLLHALYADVMREGRLRAAPVTTATFGRWMRERADSRLADLRAANPPPSPQVFDAERDRLLRDVDTFLRLEESSAAGRTPVAFEVGFGVRGDDGERTPEPLGRPDAVALRVGGDTIRVHGRIDRIDRLANGSFEVTDYKTGGFYQRKYKGTFSRGRLFQPVIYGLVAERLLRRTERRAHVSGGRYYFPTAKGEGAVHVVPRPAAATTDAVLTDLLDVAAGGAFLAAPVNASDRRRDGDPCSLCDLGGACGLDATDRAHTKFQDTGAGALEPLRRLRDAE